MYSTLRYVPYLYVLYQSVVQTCRTPHTKHEESVRNTRSMRRRPNDPNMTCIKFTRFSCHCISCLHPSWSRQRGKQMKRYQKHDDSTDRRLPESGPAPPKRCCKATRKEPFVTYSTVLYGLLLCTVRHVTVQRSVHLLRTYIHFPSGLLVRTYSNVRYLMYSKVGKGLGWGVGGRGGRMEEGGKRRGEKEGRHLEREREEPKGRRGVCAARAPPFFGHE